MQSKKQLAHLHVLPETIRYAYVQISIYKTASLCVRIARRSSGFPMFGVSALFLGSQIATLSVLKHLLSGRGSLPVALPSSCENHKRRRKATGGWCRCFPVLVEPSSTFRPFTPVTDCGGRGWGNATAHSCRSGAQRGPGRGRAGEAARQTNGRAGLRTQRGRRHATRCRRRWQYGMHARRALPMARHRWACRYARRPWPALIGLARAARDTYASSCRCRISRMHACMHAEDRMSEQAAVAGHNSRPAAGQDCACACRD